jgi:hypothetical protein
MSVLRRISALAIVCLATFCAAQLPDQLAAARILGPHWRQISRTSGMIFSGTVVKIESQPAEKGRPLPLMLMTFRVDRAIAGVRAGEVLTVREWAGAWSMQRAMTRGQRLLVFLYRPSRLGLTSPVGGRFGQVALDSRGEIVAANLPQSLSGRVELASSAEADVDSATGTARLKSCPPQTSFQTIPNGAGAPQANQRCASRNPNPPSDRTVLTHPITLAQLERAIRNARKSLAAGTPAGNKR